MVLLALLSIQVVCAGLAFVLSFWVGLPWYGQMGLAILGASSLGAFLAASFEKLKLERWCFVVACGCGAATLFVLWFHSQSDSGFRGYWDPYYATIPWLLMGALWPLTFQLSASRAAAVRGLNPIIWKSLALAWGFVGSGLWLAGSYLENLRMAFYFGLVVTVALLTLGKMWFRLPFIAIQIVNTLIVVLIGLPCADLVIRPAYRLRLHPEARQELYSYKAARKDPAAFGRWWGYYLEQANQLLKHITVPTPGKSAPFRLRPDSCGLLCQSVIHINSQGFRGEEIPRDKGNAYRIIALGESTTFGITLNAQDRPWPELLGELIRQQLALSRPVEVINAGVPGYTLENNVDRLVADILPLKPDMIISYHGINGFPSLAEGMPSTSGLPPPRYCPRPVSLLADCEFRIRILRYRHLQVARLIRRRPLVADPLKTGYARDYRRLIEFARTNHIRLVVANFAMAVNRLSDADTVQFYSVGYPAAPWLIRANELHSLIVQRLTAQNPQVRFVDTHPGLDGDPAKFIDLVHFSTAGDHQMARIIFQGIHDLLLEEDPPRPVHALNP